MNAGTDFGAAMIEAVSRLSTARQILILCHREPDADTVGSALGLAAALRAGGRNVEVIAPDSVPKNLDYLPGYAAIGQVPAGVDLVVCVDSSSRQRLGRLAAGWLDGRFPVLVIDHHVTNTHFGDTNLVDAAAPASAEVVGRLIAAAALPLNADVATCLYAGLCRDTAGFRSESTTALTLATAARWVDAGADPVLAAQRLFGTASTRQLKLEAEAIATMRVEEGGRLVWNEVSSAIAAGATEAEVEAGVDQLLRVETAQIAVLLHEIAPELVEVHIRTRAPYDAAAIAVTLGGGGHVRRSGAPVHLGLAAARVKVLKAVRVELQHHGVTHHDL